MSVNPFVHQFYDALRIIGLRDRLRCPDCKGVGTYKPHGGWFDVADERKVRRWMCKFCGLYRGPEAETRVVIGPSCWVLKSDLPDGTTPRDVLHRFRAQTNPWFG